jgi:sirohydrochlorin cobaltochelatase
VSKLKKIETHVLVCVHKTCRRQGAKASLKELKRTVKDNGLRGAVMITKVKCLGQCGRGPVMVVYPDGVWYGGVSGDFARAIVGEHLSGRQTPAGAKILRDMRDGEE